MVSLRKKSQELEQVSRLLSEHSQQIKSLERDLAFKEETIHHLRVQVEEAQVSSDRVLHKISTNCACNISSSCACVYVSPGIGFSKDSPNRGDDFQTAAGVIQQDCERTERAAVTNDNTSIPERTDCTVTAK